MQIENIVVLVLIFASDWSKIESTRTHFDLKNKPKASKKCVLASICFTVWEVCLPRRGMFHEPKANHELLSRVVDRFGDEIRLSRQARPPERPQREVRRPLAQRRPTTRGTTEITNIAANPVCHSSLPAKPHEHRAGRDFAQAFDPCISVAAARVGIRGCTSTHKTVLERCLLRQCKKTMFRYPRRPGEQGCRRSRRLLPTGFRGICALFEIQMTLNQSSTGRKSDFCFTYYLCQVHYSTISFSRVLYQLPRWSSGALECC